MKELATKLFRTCSTIP